MTTSLKEYKPLPAKPSIQQAADYLNVSVKTVRRRMSDGRLKAYRVGTRTIRVDRDSLLALAKPMGGWSI